MVNAVGQIVLGGPMEDVAALREFLAKCEELKIPDETPLRSAYVMLAVEGPVRTAESAGDGPIFTVEVYEVRPEGVME